MTPEEPTPFVFERSLDFGEANRVLPRLEKEKISFQGETDVSTHLRGSTTPFHDSRLKLFGHGNDVARWKTLQDETGLTLRMNQGLKQAPEPMSRTVTWVGCDADGR